MIAGLYFPYVSYDSLRTLNCAMLLFDEIYVINPFDISIDLASNYKEYEDFFIEERIEFMHSKIRFIPLMQILTSSKNDEELSLSIIVDLLDTEYLNVCRTSGLLSPFRISIGRIPNPELDVVHRKYYVNLPSIADGQDFQNRIHNGMINHDEYDKEKLRYLRISDERKFIYDSKEKFKNITLPFEYAQSLMINHIHIVKKELEPRTVLFSEKNMEYRILKYKFSNLNIELDPNSNKDTVEQEQLECNVSVEVGKFDIPFLYDVSNNCLIDCYLQYKEIFSKFKQKMTDLLDEIQVNVWDEMLHKKIQNQLELIIKPLVHNMEDCFNAYVTNLSAKSSLSNEIKEARITITIIPNIDQKSPKFLISNIGIPFRNVNLKNLNTKNCVILLISY
jgi:hypothetical protein